LGRKDSYQINVFQWWSSLHLCELITLTIWPLCYAHLFFFIIFIWIFIWIYQLICVFNMLEYVINNILYKNVIDEKEKNFSLFSKYFRKTRNYKSIE
jgi:uncharacterized membrane protein (DUF106 family)